MSEQTSTPQVEEAVPVQQKETAPVAAPEVSDASNKVVEEEKKPQEATSKPAEATSEGEVSEKPTSEVQAEKKEVVESSEAEKKDQVDESKKDGKVVDEELEKAKAEDKSADEQQPAKEEVASEVTNGDGHNDKKVEEPAAEETNGVCKRKAENGSEVVEEEKSPKKAKVVDDGDQAPIEETAA